MWFLVATYVCVKSITSTARYIAVIASWLLVQLAVFYKGTRYVTSHLTVYSISMHKSIINIHLLQS